MVLENFICNKDGIKCLRAGLYRPTFELKSEGNSCCQEAFWRSGLG